MKRKVDLLNILLALANPAALIVVALGLFSLSASIRNLANLTHAHDHGQPISIAIGGASTASPLHTPPVEPAPTVKHAPPATTHAMSSSAPSSHTQPAPSTPPSYDPQPTPPSSARTDTVSSATTSQPDLADNSQVVAVTGVNHVVQALNNSPDGAMVFSPGYIKIAPGDSITFQPTSYGHNSQTPEEVIGPDYSPIPPGAKTWAGAMNEEITVTFSVPGVYLYLCNYHYVVGHVGVIQVGDDTSNLEEVKKAGRALKEKMFSNANRVDLYLAEVH